MRSARLTLIVMTSAILATGIATTSFAFHSGGVAECTGCHSMHSPAPGSGAFLLQGNDDSSTCLNCHQHTGDTGPSSYHISTAEANMPTGTAPLQRTPGGDFGWLKKTYTWIGRSGPASDNGYSHGHNIIATDYAYAADPVNTAAPGGTFPGSQLACTSCHDQHGSARRMSDGSIATTGAPIIGSGSYNNSKVPATGQAVGIYRLLRGNLTQAPNAPFAGYPMAVAPSTYNQTEATNQVRVAYGAPTAANTAEWGQWCATCHPNMHTANSGVLTHPVDAQLGTTFAANYGSYVSSGIMTGTPSSSYLSLVPFAESVGDFTTLASHASNTNAYLGGPATSDQVMCLSCHRAHASGWGEALRWMTENEFITAVDNVSGAVHWPGTDVSGVNVNQAMGRTEAEAKAAYYDRAPTLFGAYQRQLCNKCHAKD